jgi:ribose transport system ATP-binding protein
MRDASKFQLRLRDITKSFGGNEVIKDLDLDVVGGEVLMLLGENGAGKSTLVKMIAGVQTPDSGSIDFGDGKILGSLSPLIARRQGVRLVPQEPSVAGTLTVAENICLGRWPRRHGIVSWSSMRDQAANTLRELEADIDPEAEIESLNVGGRQIVEIARAIANEGRCLILDEPTASLSDAEINELFSYIEQLRARNVALIYITHRLGEVERIGDRVEVLRDGAVTLADRVANVNREELVKAMVGRTVAAIQPQPPAERVPDTQPRLSFDKASRSGAFERINLSIYPKELIVIYGRLGSGADTLLESAFGLHALSSGSLEIEGKPVALKNPRQAISRGVGFIPADRKRDGGFEVLPISQNLCAPSWGNLAQASALISQAAETRVYQRWHAALGIRSSGRSTQPFDTLSGGNQQKVIVGRWLERNARILLLAEPTRGVDVGARVEIYHFLQSLAENGAAIVVSTSDAEEAAQIAQRAVVLSRGRIVGEFEGKEISVESLVQSAGG